MSQDTVYTPEALSAAERDLARLSDDVDVALTYVDTHISPMPSDVTGGSWQYVIDTHPGSVAATQSVLGSLQRLLDNAGLKLSDTRTEFADNEATNVSTVVNAWDSGLSEVTSATDIDGEIHGGIQMPSLKLKEPTSSYKEGEWLFRIASVIGACPDVADLVNQVINIATDGQFHSLPDWLENMAGGDWETVDKVSSAWGSIHDYVSDSGVQIQVSSETMLASWSGEGADACASWFGRAARSVEQADDPFDDLRHLYHSIASNVWAGQQHLSQAVSMLCDFAIGLVVTATFPPAAIITALLGAFGLVFNIGMWVLNTVIALSSEWAIVNSRVEWHAIPEV